MADRLESAMARAKRFLTDKRGPRDRGTALGLLRELMQAVRAETGDVLCGNCGVTYNRYDDGAAEHHGIGKC